MNTDRRGMRSDKFCWNDLQCVFKVEVTGIIHLRSVVRPEVSEWGGGLRRARGVQACRGSRVQGQRRWLRARGEAP
jgi:hypothetical protein